MRSVLLASLRTHTRRYVAAALAVAIAVAFVVVTDALASSARGGLTAEVGQPYEGADLVVTGGDLRSWPSEDGTDAVLAHAEAVGDSAAPLATNWLPISGSDGRSIATQAGVGSWADDPDLAWQTLVEGTAPSAPDEAVADAARAASSDVGIGDQVVVGEGDAATTFTVVGLADSSTLMPAALWVPWESLRETEGYWVDAITYALGPDHDLGTTTAALEALADDGDVGATADDAEVDPGATYVGDLGVHSPDEVAEDRLAQANQQVDVLSMVLLLFGAIAAVVSVMVIANTFTILFAQRQRDLALLRCVGATRRQVRRSIRVEALVMGVLASLAGLGLGAALGFGGVAVLRAAVDFPLGAVSPTPSWWLAAFVGGVLTTVLAAWFPTRAATRVSPLAALRPEAAPTMRTTSGRFRIAVGALVLAGGGALLAASVVLENVVVMVAGGTAFFAGVVLLGPVIVPALLRVVGALVRRTGPAARLAGENAVRNPRRTAATTASLLIGVTLTTAVLTGMASARSATDAELDQQYPVDAVVATEGGGLTTELTDRVTGLDDVETSLVLPGGRVAVSPGEAAAEAAADDGVAAEDLWTGTDVPVVSPAAAAGADEALGTVVRGDRSVAEPADDELVVPYDVAEGLGVPEQVDVSVGDRTVTLRTTMVDNGWGSALLVSPTTLDTLLGGSTAPYAVWLRADAGADVDGLAADLDAATNASDASADIGLQQRDWVDFQLDVVVIAVVGLLGIGIVIALIGIGNTLGLSVLERSRENALLRALGLTRRQLRRTLAAEGVLLSVAATLIGTATGVFFAVVGVLVMVRPTIPDASLVLPWGQLGAVVLVAALAGLVSCVLPARRAARTAPAAGLALD